MAKVNEAHWRLVVLWVVVSVVGGSGIENSQYLDELNVTNYQLNIKEVNLDDFIKLKQLNDQQQSTQNQSIFNQILTLNNNINTNNTNNTNNNDNHIDDIFSQENMKENKGDQDINVKESKQKQKQEMFNQFRFRGIHSFLNDVEFASLDEIPMDQSIKRQIEDLLVLPRVNNHELSFQQKHNRLLFFGFSKELMQNTAKAIAIQNKWLFTEIDVQELLIKFLYQDNSNTNNYNYRDNSFTQLFQYAKKESMDQKVTYMIVIKDIEELLIKKESGEEETVVRRAREWLFEQLEKFNSYKNQFEEDTRDIFREVYDIVVIFITSHPTAINEHNLQRLVNKAIFFDFSSLRGVKIFFAQELYKLTSKVNVNRHRKKDEDTDDNVDNNNNNNNNNYNRNTDSYNNNNKRFKKVGNRARMKELNNNNNNNNNNNSEKTKEDEDEDNKNNRSSDELLKQKQRRNVRNQNQEFNNRGHNMNNLRRSHLTFRPVQLNSNNREILPYERDITHQQQVQRDQAIVDSLFDNNYNNYDNNYNFIQLDSQQNHNQQSSSFLQIEQNNDKYQNENSENENNENNKGYSFENNQREQKRRKRKRELQRCSKYNGKSQSTQVIHKNQLEIVIEKRNDVNQWENNGQLLGDDNIIMIKGPQICMIFDWDLDSYIIDHALPLKTNANPTADPFHSVPPQDNTLLNNQNTFYDKPGLIYEDIRNLVKLTLHLELRDNQEDYSNQFLESNEPYYQVTEKSLKQAFINYKPIVSLYDSNAILQWAKLHAYLVTKLQYMAGQYLFYHNNHSTDVATANQHYQQEQQSQYHNQQHNQQHNQYDNQYDDQYDNQYDNQYHNQQPDEVYQQSLINQQKDFQQDQDRYLDQQEKTLQQQDQKLNYGLKNRQEQDYQNENDYQQQLQYDYPQRQKVDFQRQYQEEQPEDYRQQQEVDTNNYYHHFDNINDNINDIEYNHDIHLPSQHFQQHLPLHNHQPLVMHSTQQQPLTMTMGQLESPLLLQQQQQQPILLQQQQQQPILLQQQQQQPSPVFQQQIDQMKQLESNINQKLSLLQVKMKQINQQQQLQQQMQEQQTLKDEIMNDNSLESIDDSSDSDNQNKVNNLYHKALKYAYKAEGAKKDQLDNKIDMIDNIVTQHQQQQQQQQQQEQQQQQQEQQGGLIVDEDKEKVVNLLNNLKEQVGEDQKEDFISELADIKEQVDFANNDQLPESDRKHRIKQVLANLQQMKIRYTPHN